jgi:hypothetical protein
MTAPKRRDENADGAEDEPLYEEVASSWRAAVNAAEDLRIISNFACLFLRFDPLEGARLLSSKPSSDPISVRVARASTLLADAIALGVDSEELRARCLEYGAMSLRFDDGDDEERTFTLMCTLAKLVDDGDPARAFLKEATRRRPSSDGRDRGRERLRLGKLAAEAMASRR